MKAEKPRLLKTTMPVIKADAEKYNHKIISSKSAGISNKCIMARPIFD
jgi:hypothetical protein